jgi:thioredoxin-dependent peroxiredoxin
MTEHRLSPGDPAPDFSLLDDTGVAVSRTGLLGRKTILYFYPAAMTPGCSKQACDFTASLDDLTSLDYQIVGVSPDPPAKLAEFRVRDGLTIALLSDPEKATMAAYGAYGEKKLYGKTVRGVIRSTFVLDEQGTIRIAQYNVKATGHVAKLMRDLGMTPG